LQQEKWEKILVVLLAAGEAQGPEDDLNRSGGYDLDTLRRRRRER